MNQMTDIKKRDKKSNHKLKTRYVINKDQWKYIHVNYLKVMLLLRNLQLCSQKSELPNGSLRHHLRINKGEERG